VSRTLNVDGQGFNDATLLKYAGNVAAQSPNITTIAGAMDFVNLLFTPVGSQIYIEPPDPGWLGDKFANNHSLIAVLQRKENSVPDGNGGLVMRPVAGQDPAMGDAAGFVAYLQKFMGADDFALLCSMAMGLKTGAVGVTDIINTTALAGQTALALGPLAIPEVVLSATTINEPGALGLIMTGVLLGNLGDANLAGMLSNSFRPPYANMLTNLLILLGNYIQHNDIDDPAVVRGLIATVVSGVWGVTVTDVVLTELVDDLSNVPNLPYSTTVRDFTDQTRQELLAIVVPGPEPEACAAAPSLPELDFGDDEAAWRDYRRQVIETQCRSRDKINQIFDDVEAASQDHARTARAMAERVSNAARRLSALNYNLR
jgi:hypothetical protein